MLSSCREVDVNVAKPSEHQLEEPHGEGDEKDVRSHSQGDLYHFVTDIASSERNVRCESDNGGPAPPCQTLLTQQISPSFQSRACCGLVRSSAVISSNSTTSLRPPRGCASPKRRTTRSGAS